MTDATFDPAAARRDFAAAGRSLKAELKGTVHWPAHDADGRTRQAVLRDSVWDRLFADWFRPIAMKAKQLIMRFLERLCFWGMERANRAERSWYGAHVRPGDLSVARYLLFEKMDNRTGRLDPSYKDIAGKTGKGMTQISAAIRRLERLGVLQRKRRFRVLEGDQGERARVEQTTNAYRWSLPPLLYEVLGIAPPRETPSDRAQRRARAGYERQAPPPEDDVVRRREASIDHDVYEAQDTGKKTIGSILRRWEQAFSTRDSRDGRESPASPYISRSKRPRSLD